MRPKTMSKVRAKSVSRCSVENESAGGGCRASQYDPVARIVHRTAVLITPNLIQYEIVCMNATPRRASGSVSDSVTCGAEGRGM